MKIPVPFVSKYTVESLCKNPGLNPLVLVTKLFGTVEDEHHSLQQTTASGSVREKCCSLWLKPWENCVLGAKLVHH